MAEKTEKATKLRPICLKGHSRPITKVKFNREGDLLVTCGKDFTPQLW
jgi:translation initiation factor 3 subunit I